MVQPREIYTMVMCLTATSVTEKLADLAKFVNKPLKY